MSEPETPQPLFVTGPRADFACRACGKRQGTDAVVYQDLPAKATRCPVCGARRGFLRLFTGVQISTSAARSATQFIDETIGPAVTAHQQRHEAAQAFEREAERRYEAAYAKASTQDRPHIPKVIKQWLSPTEAQAALSGLPAEARAASRSHAFPALINREVKPIIRGAG